VKFLVANKCDLNNQRQVNKFEGFNTANTLGISFKEVSAKTGEEVEELFESIVK